MNEFNDQPVFSYLKTRNQARNIHYQIVKGLLRFVVNNIGFFFLISFFFYDISFSFYNPPFFRVADIHQDILFLSVGIGGLLSYFFVVDIRIWLFFCFLESLILLAKVYLFLTNLTLGSFSVIGFLSCIVVFSEFITRYQWLQHFSSRRLKKYPRRK